MKAIRPNNGRVEVVDVPRPTGPGVRVRVRSAGICGSDLHMIAGGFPVSSILGHEIAGETSDGQLVAIEPLKPCNACGFCQKGAYNLCAIGPQMWIGTGSDGGMAEEILVPDRCVVPLPKGLTASDACIVEPLAVATHAIRRARLRSGERAVVVGGVGTENSSSPYSRRGLRISSDFRPLVPVMESANTRQARDPCVR